MTPSEKALDDYRRPGRMSDPGAHTDAIARLSADLPTLARAVQGLILHEHWSGAYGQTLSEARRAEVHLRALPAMLDQLLSHDPSPLTAPRAPEHRLVGNCRDFSLLTIAGLRAQGIPARARCGFGAYFEPGRYVDHWVAEYWNADRARWVMADAQIDDLQADRLRPDFDVLDVPADRFLTGGAAWRACRSGVLDPDLFGIIEMRGLWFIAGNLIRDAASLAGNELLPWDCWGAMPKPGEAVPDQALAWFDRLADLTGDPDTHHVALMALARGDPGLAVPPVVFNAVRGQPDVISS